jgi:hypothetical protein
MITKAIESAAWLNLTTNYKAKGITCLYWISQPTKQSNKPTPCTLGFVFASDDGGTTIGVVVFVTEGLGFVVAL